MAVSQRRKFLATLTCAFVALGVVVGSALADELSGFITKVNASGKTITVTPEGDNPEGRRDQGHRTTRRSSPRRASSRSTWRKLSKRVDGAKDKGAKGVQAKITHEKGTASKIQYVFQKKAANPAN